MSARCSQMKYLAAIDLLRKILWYKNRESTYQKTFYFLLQIQQFSLFVRVFTLEEYLFYFPWSFFAKRRD